MLDEPVSALDVSIRAQIMNLLKDIQAAYGLSYLLIAHNLATVRYMSHAVAIMYLGEVVEFAEGDELFEHPLHPYTKALMSAALPAHPDEVVEEIVLSGEMPSPINPPQRLSLPPALPGGDGHLSHGGARGDPYRRPHGQLPPVRRSNSIKGVPVTTGSNEPITSDGSTCLSYCAGRQRCCRARAPRGLHGASTGRADRGAEAGEPHQPAHPRRPRPLLRCRRR